MTQDLVEDIGITCCKKPVNKADSIIVGARVFNESTKYTSLFDAARRRKNSNFSKIIVCARVLIQ